MKSFKYLIAIALLLIVATGCDDKKYIESNQPVNKELTFSSHADIYNVSLEQCSTWEVKSYPEWATPMQDVGTGDTKISVFVEDNFTEMERKGELVVITDKNEIIYSLTQRSTLTEDTNAEIVSDNILYLTYGVGQGINVFGNPTSGAKYYYAGAIVNPALLTKMLSEVGEADAFCAEDHYFSHTESLSGTSTSSLSTQLSVNAGIEAEISGFSGSLSGKFTSNESTNTNTAYAMREIKHIVGSRYLRSGVLRYLSAANKTSVFATGFNELVEVIKEDPNEKDAIHDLLETYGTHLIVHGTLGGELELAMEMTSTETISEMDINAALNASCAVLNAGAAFNMTDDEKKLMKNTKISLKTYGGGNTYTLSPGSTIEETMQYVLKAENLDKWIKSIKDKSSLALIDVQLYPIYDLMPDSTTRAAVREYMINEYQEKKTKKKPLLFAVNGFGDNGVITGEAYIPELDIKLECYSEKIPEISNEEPVIMIYSGTRDEMNYNTGFFIGSETLKPGKLRKNREGVYSFEPFEELSKGQITELYVNATGDITISGKTGVAYSEVKFTGITKEDLNRNRFPLASERKWAKDNDPSHLIEQNILKEWRWVENIHGHHGHIACAISLKDENDKIKELIQAQKVNVVIEKPQSEAFSLTTVAVYYYEDYSHQVFDDDQTFEYSTTLEYPITPNVNYIAYHTASPVDYWGRDWEKEVAPKLYFKLVEKNSPRWK